MATACQSSSAPSAAPAPHPALASPSVERARLEYAFDSAKRIAEDWRWLRANETCVLLIARGAMAQP